MNTDSSKVEQCAMMSVDELRRQLLERYDNPLLAEDLIAQAIESGKLVVTDKKGEVIPLEQRNGRSATIQAKWVKLNETRERDEDSVIGIYVSPRVLLRA